MKNEIHEISYRIEKPCECTKCGKVCPKESIMTVVIATESIECLKCHPLKGVKTNGPKIQS